MPARGRFLHLEASFPQTNEKVEKISFYPQMRQPYQSDHKCNYTYFDSGRDTR